MSYPVWLERNFISPFVRVSSKRFFLHSLPLPCKYSEIWGHLTPSFPHPVRKSAADKENRQVWSFPLQTYLTEQRISGHNRKKVRYWKPEQWHKLLHHPLHWSCSQENEDLVCVQRLDGHLYSHRETKGWWTGWPDAREIQLCVQGLLQDLCHQWETQTSRSKFTSFLDRYVENCKLTLTWFVFTFLF